MTPCNNFAGIAVHHFFLMGRKWHHTILWVGIRISKLTDIVTVLNQLKFLYFLKFYLRRILP